MPNWSYNKFSVKGNKQDLIKFINDGLKQAFTRCKNKPQVDELNNDTIELLNHLPNGRVLAMSSYLPMPKTFRKWDTTNTMRTFIQYINEVCLNGKKSLKEKGYTKWLKEEEITDEIREKYQSMYDEYVKGWENAKQYQMEKYGVVGWYDWGLKYYGTKWDAELTDFQIEWLCDDEYLLIFQNETAWSLPSAWLSFIQKKYKKLKFFIFSEEEGFAYCGYGTANCPLCVAIDYKEVIEKAKEKGYKDDMEEYDEENYGILYDTQNEMVDELYINYDRFIRLN